MAQSQINSDGSSEIRSENVEDDGYDAYQARRIQMSSAYGREDAVPEPAESTVDEAIHVRARMKEAIDSAEEYKSALARMIEGMSITEYKIYEMRISTQQTMRDRG